MTPAELLDELMGKDRNVPVAEKAKHQESFKDANVCKAFLVGLCPHDLFPNTKSDLGPCPKAHDEHLRIKYETDPDRPYYEAKYERQLLADLESLISQIDQKIRRSMGRINAPLPELERPKEVTDRINQINDRISGLLKDAEVLGEQGRVDESEAMMNQVEKLKASRDDMMRTGESMLLEKEKKMKVCEVCGAMQSSTDTERRTVSHLEGKQHLGFLQVREKVEQLKAKFAAEEKPFVDRSKSREREPDRRVRSRSRDRRDGRDSRDSRDYRDRDRDRGGRGRYDNRRDSRDHRDYRDRDRRRSRSRSRSREHDRRRYR
eukprot:GILK01004117.1.p1 GENE.GILK01004117.1~~GILK01004117.1.p1  ORF type:complete len:334 (-),score=53.76 GILK01004117.1:102-1058(-)